MDFENRSQHFTQKVFKHVNDMHIFKKSVIYIFQLTQNASYEILYYNEVDHNSRFIIHVYEETNYVCWNSWSTLTSSIPSEY